MKRTVLSLFAILAMLSGFFVYMGGAAVAANTEPCVPKDAWTETVVIEEGWVEKIQHPAIPAVTEERLVSEAVYVTEYEFVHKNPNHPNSPRWEEEGWNADGNPNSVGWESTGNTRETLVSEAVYETVEISPAIPAWTEIVKHPAVTETIEHPAVECPEEPVDPGQQPDPVYNYHEHVSVPDCDTRTLDVVRYEYITEYVLSEDGTEWVKGEKVRTDTPPYHYTIPANAVHCPTPPEPEVLESSSIHRVCAGGYWYYQTEHVTETTEYVLSEDGLQWVKGEPVVETTYSHEETREPCGKNAEPEEPVVEEETDEDDENTVVTVSDTKAPTVKAAVKPAKAPVKAAQASADVLPNTGGPSALLAALAGALVLLGGAMIGFSRRRVRA